MTPADKRRLRLSPIVLAMILSAVVLGLMAFAGLVYITLKTFLFASILQRVAT